MLCDLDRLTQVPTGAAWPSLGDEHVCGADVDGGRSPLSHTGAVTFEDFTDGRVAGVDVGDISPASSVFRGPRPTKHPGVALTNCDFAALTFDDLHGVVASETVGNGHGRQAHHPNLDLQLDDHVEVGADVPGETARR